MVRNPNVVMFKNFSILNSITIITFCSIVLGNLYEYCYFEEFNVNIYNYSQPSEIFTLFIPSLYRILISLIFIFLILSLFFRNTFTKYVRINRTDKSAFSKNRKRANFFKTVFVKKGISIFLVMLFLEAIVQIIPSNNYYWYAILKLVSFWFSGFGVILFMLIGILIISRIFIIQHLKFIIVSFSVIIIAQTIYMLATFDVWNVKNKNGEFPSEYDFGFRAIKTSDSFRLIGATNEYFFFDSLGHNGYEKTLVFKKSEMVNSVNINNKTKIYLWQRKPYPPHEP